MLKFTLLAVALTCAFGTHTGIIYEGVPLLEVENLQCVSKVYGVDQIIVNLPVDETDTEAHKNFVIDYQNAQSVGLKFEVTFNPVFEKAGNDPETLCSYIVNTLPSSYEGVVWLTANIFNFGKDPVKLLSYYEEVAETCTQKGLSMGVRAELVVWQIQMGDASSPSGKLTSLPLMYDGPAFDSNLTGDWNYFKFGSWEAPEAKIYGFYTEACGYDGTLYTRK